MEISKIKNKHNIFTLFVYWDYDDGIKPLEHHTLYYFYKNKLKL